MRVAALGGARCGPCARTRPWEAEKLMRTAALGARAAARVCCKGVLASIFRLAATLEGAVAVLSASLSF